MRFPSHILFFILSHLVLLTPAAAKPEAVFRSVDVIVYAWVKPTALPAVTSTEGQTPQTYEPREYNWYLSGHSDTERVTVGENEFSPWLNLRTASEITLSDENPAVDSGRKPLAQAVIPTDAHRIALFVFESNQRYRIMPVEIANSKSVEGHVKIANFGSDTVFGRVGEEVIELKPGDNMVYRFDEKSTGDRFSFAYQKDKEWNPFFDSFVARPRQATSMLFIYPYSNSSAEGYSIRRLMVPLTDQNGKPEIVGD